MVPATTPGPYLSPKRSLSLAMISSRALRCFSWMVPEPMAVIGSRPGPSARVSWTESPLAMV